VRVLVCPYRLSQPVAAEPGMLLLLLAKHRATSVLRNVHDEHPSDAHVMATPVVLHWPYQ